MRNENFVSSISVCRFAQIPYRTVPSSSPHIVETDLPAMEYYPLHALGMHGMAWHARDDRRESRLTVFVTRDKDAHGCCSLVCRTKYRYLCLSATSKIELSQGVSQWDNSNCVDSTRYVVQIKNGSILSRGWAVFVSLSQSRELRNKCNSNTVLVRAVIATNTATATPSTMPAWGVLVVVIPSS